MLLLLTLEKREETREYVLCEAAARVGFLTVEPRIKTKLSQISFGKNSHSNAGVDDCRFE